MTDHEPSLDDLAKQLIDWERERACASDEAGRAFAQEQARLIAGRMAALVVLAKVEEGEV